MIIVGIDDRFLSIQEFTEEPLVRKGKDYRVYASRWLVLGAYALVFIPLSIPISRLIDKFGSRPVVAAGAVIVALVQKANGAFLFQGEIPFRTSAERRLGRSVAAIGGGEPAHSRSTLFLPAFFAL